MKNNLEKKLWSRAKFATHIICQVPFVRMISVNGSLANKKIHKDSDIDFFIITEKKRLWTVRFLVFFLLDLFFLRAKHTKHKGRICLNHFLSNENCILTLQNSYNAYQYSNLKILYQEKDTYRNFISKNLWIKKYVPIKKNIYKKNYPSLLKKSAELVLKGKIGNWLEKKIFQLQTKRIKNNIFFRQNDSFLKISHKEFYYYTNVRYKYNKHKTLETLDK